LINQHNGLTIKKKQILQCSEFLCRVVWWKVYREDGGNTFLRSVRRPLDVTTRHRVT